VQQDNPPAVPNAVPNAVPPEVYMPDIYDPPPVPDGVSADTAYMAQVYASGTRAILREASRRHEELLRAHKAGAERPGWGGVIGEALSKLPAPVQTSLLLAGGLFGYQLLGTVFIGLTGGTLPQLQVPPIIVTETPPTPPLPDLHATPPE